MFVRLRLGPVLLLPRFGARVCAGFPSPADDYIEDEVDLTRLVVGNPLATFLWTAQGECMVGAGIFDGDMLVVDRSLEPVPGDIVVAVVDGQPSVKRLVAENGQLGLMIENPAMPAFAVAPIAEVAIWGVVRWTLRRHPGASR